MNDIHRRLQAYSMEHSEKLATARRDADRRRAARQEMAKLYYPRPDEVDVRYSRMRSAAKA